MNNPVARIMDVNFNRAGEALRTLEEYARFVLESPALARRAKTLRHDLAQALRRWNDAHAPADRPLPNRDIAGDVGATIKTEAEGVRVGVLSVAAAAARRAAEALRVLSEYAKIDDAAIASEFERIRYGLYALEPVLLADGQRRKRLAAARLCVVVTTALCAADARAAAAQAVAGGADVIQLREEEMQDREFHRLAADLAEICREGGALFLIHGRPHIASLVDADGVCGGQDDLPAHLTRRLLGTDRLIGVRISMPEQAERALADGADCICVEPEDVAWAAQWGGLPFFASVDAAVTQAADIAAATAIFKEKLQHNTCDGLSA